MDNSRPLIDKSLLSDFAIKNITELANHLKTVAVALAYTPLTPESVTFGMQTYMNKYDVEIGHACNTSACAVGHFALMRGYNEGSDEAVVTENNNWLDWDDFSEIHIGITRTGDEGVIWEWLFAASWSYFDDTPLGAAARIEYFLEHGVPNEFFKLFAFKKPEEYSDEDQKTRRALLDCYLDRRQVLEAKHLTKHNLINHTNDGATHG